MYQLVIDRKRCVECGTCELILPNLFSLANSGRVLVSPTNADRHHKEIQEAIDNCHLEALSLEDVSAVHSEDVGGPV